MSPSPSRRLALVLLLPLALALGAVPAMEVGGTTALPDPSDPELGTQDRLRALIERMKLEQTKLQTLEASFVQLRESDLLIEPEESRGVFSFAAPDRVRWEYQSPKPISIVIDGEEMVTWYRDLGRAEKLQVGRYSEQVFKYLGASGSMETLVDYFRVSVRFPKEAGEPYRLKLLPKYDRIAARLESMTLWIDPARYFPVKVRYVTAAGDVTEYRFEDLRINGGIPGERFELDLPPGIETRQVDLGAR